MFVGQVFASVDICYILQKKDLLIVSYCIILYRNVSCSVVQCTITRSILFHITVVWHRIVCVVSQCDIVVSYFLVFCHIIIYRTMLHRIVLYCLVSCCTAYSRVHNLLYYIVSYILLLYPNIAYRIVQLGIISQYIAWYRIISCGISYFLVSYRIVFLCDKQKLAVGLRNNRLPDLLRP